MKYILLLILCLGCTPPNPPEYRIQLTNTGGIVTYIYKTVVIDKCEYLIFDGGTSHTLTHKGNCTNHHENL